MKLISLGQDTHDQKEGQCDYCGSQGTVYKCYDRGEDYYNKPEMSGEYIWLCETHKNDINSYKSHPEHVSECPRCGLVFG